jgi:predicted small lipoprotein YifL
MRNRIAKLLSACLAALVLVSFAGCGEDKGPVRQIDPKDVKTDPGKDGAR